MITRQALLQEAFLKTVPSLAFFPCAFGVDLLVSLPLGYFVDSVLPMRTRAVIASLIEVPYCHSR